MPLKMVEFVKLYFLKKNSEVHYYVLRKIFFALNCMYVLLKLTMIIQFQT